MTVLFVLFIGLVAIAIIFLSNMSRGTKGVFICSCITISAIIIPQFKLETSQYIQLDEKKILFYKRPITWTLEMKQIKKIRYSGILWIPMSEVLILESDIEKIKIDFNFYHYLDVWREVIYACLNETSEVVLSNRLVRRLKLVI